MIFMYHKIFSPTKQQIISFCCFVLSMLFCTFVKLFGTSFPLYNISFVDLFLDFFIKETLPMIYVYLLFFLISKDSVEYKIRAFFPVVASFYAVFIPYRIIFSDIDFSPFILFCKPVIYLSAIIAFSISFYFCYSFIKEKNKLLSVLFSIFAVLFFLFPSIISAFYFSSMISFLWISLFVLLICSTLFLLFFLLKKE